MFSLLNILSAQRRILGEFTASSSLKGILDELAIITSEPLRLWRSVQLVYIENTFLHLNFLNTSLEERNENILT